MPEISPSRSVSPSNTLAQVRRLNAAIYLNHGAKARLVWIVIPEQGEGVEVCRLDANGRGRTRKFIGAKTAALSGEDVLPGFELELASLFV